MIYCEMLDTLGAWMARQKTAYGSFETKGKWKGRTVDEDASAARHVELTRQAIHPMTAP